MAAIVRIKDRPVAHHKARDVSTARLAVATVDARRNVTSAAPRMTVALASGEVTLDVRHFVVEETVSDLFEIAITAQSSDPNLDLDAIAVHPAVFRVSSGSVAMGPQAAPNPGPGKPAPARARSVWRAWSGLCSRIELSDVEPSGLSTYTIRIVPSLWLATQRTNHRVFERASTPEIVEAVLREWEIEAVWRLNRSAYPKHDCRIQHGETDFAFVRRLLEEAGLAFFFAHEGERSDLVITDEAHRSAPREGGAIPFAADASAAKGRVYVSRVSVVRDAQPGAAPRARLARAIGDLAPPSSTVVLCTNALDVGPGAVIAIGRHPRADLARPLLVLGASLEGTSDGECIAEVRATFADAPYLPARTTPKPEISVLQSAVVVAPEGGVADELGRVRVKFAWEDEAHRTCSARLASKGVVLRAGDEVLVGFLGGDPDAPVIVGHAYERAPLSRVGGLDTDASNDFLLGQSNSVRLMHVEARRDLTKVVKRDQTEHSGRDHHVGVGRNRSVAVRGVDSTVVGERYSVTVADPSETGMVMADRCIAHTTGDATMSLSDGDMSVDAGGHITLDASGDMALRAIGNLTLEAGGTITIKAAGVVIDDGSRKIGHALPVAGREYARRRVLSRRSRSDSRSAD